jgi:hypothetical protein
LLPYVCACVCAEDNSDGSQEVEVNNTILFSYCISIY